MGVFLKFDLNFIRVFDWKIFLELTIFPLKLETDAVEERIKEVGRCILVLSELDPI